MKNLKLSPYITDLLFLKKHQKYKAPSLKTSAIFNSLVSFFNIIIPFISTPYLSRILSPDGIGTYNYLLSLTSYFNLVIGFGFLGYATSTIAKYRDDSHKVAKTFSEVFYAKLLLLASMLSIFYTLLLAGIFGSDSKYMLILSLNIFCTGINTSFLFQGLEKFKQLSLITALIKLLNLILIFIFIKKESDLPKYFIIEGALFLVQVVLYLYFCTRYTYFVKVKFKDVLLKYRYSFKFFIPEIAISLYTVLDTTMLGSLSTANQVAFYSSSNRIINLVVSIVGSIAPILLSRISYLYETKQYKEAKTLLQKVISFSMIIVLPSIFGLIIVGSYFVPFYFGPDYNDAIPVLTIMTPLIFLLTLSNILINGYFIPSGKRNLSTIFAFIAAAVNLALNTYTIPNFGAIGAAVSTIIAEGIVTFLNMWFARKFISYGAIFGNSIKIICATLLMSLTILCFNYYFSFNTYVMLAANILIGVFIYFLALFIFKDENLMYLRNFIKNKIRKK